MFFIKTILANRERKRAESEAKRKREQEWRDRQNAFYDIGDSLNEAFNAVKNYAGWKALGIEANLSKDFLAPTVYDWNVDGRLKVNLVERWSSELADELDRPKKEFRSLLTSTTFYIDGIPIEYNNEEYRKLARKVIDVLKEKVLDIEKKKKTLVEDYLNSREKKEDEGDISETN